MKKFIIPAVFIAVLTGVTAIIVNVIDRNNDEEMN